MRRIVKLSSLFFAGALVLSGCGAFRDADLTSDRTADEILDDEIYGEAGPPSSTLISLLRNRGDAERVGSVNKYIWNASLEVLSFLPVESADPFGGLITTGFGTPPGGGRAYRATIFIDDPALDARSLNLALATRSGPASPDTVRAVEDAILTRARQLRQEDDRF